MNDEMIAEFSGNVRFLNPKNVSLVDSEGTKIEVPLCPICNKFMSMLMGKEAFKWSCNFCPTEDK